MMSLAPLIAYAQHRGSVNVQSVAALVLSVCWSGVQAAPRSDESDVGWLLNSRVYTGSGGVIDLQEFSCQGPGLSRNAKDGNSQPWYPKSQTLESRVHLLALRSGFRLRTVL